MRGSGIEHGQRRGRQRDRESCKERCYVLQELWRRNDHSRRHMKQLFQVMAGDVLPAQHQVLL